MEKNATIAARCRGQAIAMEVLVAGKNVLMWHMALSTRVVIEKEKTNLWIGNASGVRKNHQFLGGCPCVTLSLWNGLFSYSQGFLRFEWQLDKDEIRLWIEIIFA